MNCEEIEELSGAYVLGAVTDDQRKAIEEHLEQCPEAARLVQELQAIVNILPLSVPQTEPSALVKGRVMAAIQADHARKPVHLVPPPSTVTKSSPVLSSRVQYIRSQAMTAVSVLLLVIVLALGAWNVSLQQHMNQLAASNNSLQQQVAQLSTSIRSHTPVDYTIKGSPLVPGAVGEVTYIPELDMTVLLMHNLPATKGTQVYQGWLLQGKHPTSVGLLNILNGTATLNFSGNIKGFNTAAITLEPGPLPSKYGPQGKIVASGVLA